MALIRIGVLASGGGSNLQSIIDRTLDGYLDAEVAVVISNNSTAGALARAARHGLPGLHISEKTEDGVEEADRRITAELLLRGVELVALAGYMKKIGPALLAEFQGRILNIHPALLPKYGGRGMYGMRVHEAVIAAGDTESGATVHLVDGEYDHGKILAQARVPVLPGDTSEILQKRVLEQEHRIYPETIRTIIAEMKH